MEQVIFEKRGWLDNKIIWTYNITVLYNTVIKSESMIESSCLYWNVSIQQPRQDFWQRNPVAKTRE